MKIGNNLKKWLSVFLSIVFVMSTSAQNPSRNERSSRPVNVSGSSGGGSSKSNDSSLSSSSTGSSNKSSRNERSQRSTNSSSSNDERPSRTSGERPVRPQSSNHDSHHDPHHGHNNYSGHHHDHYDEHRHHHHVHSGGTVVVAGTGYSAASTSAYEASSTVSRNHDINRFMLFANLSCGVSYRGASGVHEYEYCDEDVQIDEENRAFVESLGYNVEVRTDVGLTRRLFCSSGVGFSKQSFYKMFSPGNYMSSTKRFLEFPFMFGFRDDDDEDFIFSVSVGPRLTYGINGKCDEYYDFYPEPEYGVFSHDSYGGKYGVDRFSVGAGIETQFVIYRFLLGLNFSLYPNNDCKPAELYDGLYRRFHSCRTNISIKAGWKIF